jgi:TonB family protein
MPGLSGMSVILVLLDPANKVVNVRVERSSGNRSLDYVALAAARRSEFQGQTFRCRPIKGSYLFSVEFNP